MVIVVGSRHEGNSYKLASKIKEALDKERIHVKIISPGNQKIHICTGCRDCDKDGVCDFTDDMKNNIEDIRNDDCVMFITPTRWNLLSGDLKIFMDRLNPMYTRKELKDKKMIAVAIGAKPVDYCSVEAALNSLESFCESAQMNLVLKKQFCNCLEDNDILVHEDDINTLISEIKTAIK